MKTIDSQRPNPFPGLRPFRSDEHHLFFGREEQTAALLQLLRTNRFLAVVGTSGSGKSSLVRAGMIAELHGGTMTQAGSTWEVMILRPGGSPIENLARAMVEASLYDPEDPSSLPRLLATLNRSRFGLVEAMKQSEVFEPGTNLLVVVDQFEELFRFRQQDVDSEETAAAFVNLLLSASDQAECPIYVTITMRSDYLGDCSEIPGLAEAVNEGEYLIPRLLRDQKRDAIEKPIGVGGAKISPLLVQRLLNEVGDDPDQLPVLQHALMRMWDAWSAGGDHNRPIDFGDFEATGGLGAALSNHADEIYDSLPDDCHRSVCGKIFKALTQKGDDNRGIRRPTRLAQLQAIADSDRGTLTTVLDSFRGSGVTFLMPGTEVELRDRTVLDLSHESLMRGWQRLRGWVEDEAQSARIFRRLLDTARLWSDGKAGLFRDPDLQSALSWREQEAPNAEWAEQYGGHFETAIGFLETSNAEAEAERQAKEAARQRELEQARQLAEAQQLRLEQQQRAARKLRKMIGGLAAVAVIAGIACVAALIANQRANTLADNARRNEEKANENAKRAEQSQQETANVLGVVESQKAEVEGSLSKAKAAERLARAAEEAGRKLLYTTDMRLAPFVWRDDRTTAEQLRVLLAKHIPVNKPALALGAGLPTPPAAADLKPDLRGFEWHYYQHLLESSAAVFSGHDVSVAAGAFTSNGQLVTLDQKGQVRRWDVGSQEEDKASRPDLPGGPSAQVRALSPNGRLAALAEGNKVHVFDTTTGKLTFQIDSANVESRRLIFSRDSDRLVIVDNKIRWCNALSGEVIASVDQKYNRGNSLALSADGLTLAVVGHGASGQQFSIFRLEATAKKVTPLAKDVGPGGTLSASALSPDGQRIAIGGKLSPVLFVFDTATGRAIAQHQSAHASPIAAMAFSGDGAKLATTDAEGTIKIWADAQKLNSKSTALLTLKGHQGAIITVGFSSDGKRLVTTSVDKTARVWDLEKVGAAIRPLERSSSSFVARFSPNGQCIATASGPSVRLWDAATGRLVRVLSADDKSGIYSVAFSPTDNRLLAVGHGGQADVSYVALWDIDAGTELARLPGATDLPSFRGDANSRMVGALAFSPDGKYLVAGFGSKNLFTGDSSPNPLKVWEIATRRLIRRLNGHTGYCVSLDFSRDGKLLASGSRDGTAIIWSTQTWNRAQTLQNPDNNSLYSGRGMVEDVAFSPDGKTLALASREGSVQLWDVASGKLLETLKGHSSAVSAVVFSPDGRTLASGSVDQTVRLWNVETRRELMQLDSGSVGLGQVRTLAFSADGKHLLAGGARAAFWSAAPIVWNDPDRAAEKLRLVLNSNADFQSRIRMLSESLRLHEALAKLDAKDVRVQAALAATRANWHASRQAWPEAALAFDRLLAADRTEPEAWLRTPGLLRLATALFHENRSADAAMLLQGGAKRRTQDGLPHISRVAGFGFQYVVEDGAIRVRELLAGSPAERSNLLPGDVIVKVNGVETAKETIPNYGKMVAGAVGTKVRLTVRHPGKTQTEDVDLVKENYLVDAATGELCFPLLAALEKRLAKDPKDAGLLELRAELAGQESDLARQVADYTAAIKILAVQPAEAVSAPLRRLYRRRGDAYVGLKKWPEAVDDYAHVVTDATTDEVLLSNQALALAEVLLPSEIWTVLKPVEAKSELGATLSILPDDSILASGANPAKDRYRVVLTVGTNIDLAAVRLEALTHPSLPGNGPGRNSVGNFAQISWRVTARSPDRKDPITLEFNSAWADHQYTDYPINTNGHWNVYGGHGGNCTAIWSMSNRVTLAAGTTLTFEMQFQEWNDFRENLGRFRLSLSSDPAALDRERKRLAMAKLSDPWQKLATAYRFKGDQQAIDQLIERRPKLASQIGDLFIQGKDEEKDWRRAIALYSKGITAETTDAELLSKRASAHEALSNWDAAAAEWSRAATGNPDGAKLLAEFARRLAAGSQVVLAKAQFEKSQALYERSLAADPDNDLVVPELAQLLWDKHENENPTRWTVLKPVEAKSELGATLSILPDHSILASGSNPLNDRYRVVLTIGTDTDLAAVRLEALAHPSLPGNGPGRYTGRNGGQFRGTFVQESWNVSSTSPNRKNPIALVFDNAWADHQFVDSPIKSNGFWNIAGSGEGRDCTAVWSMSKPVSLAAGTTLIFEMQNGAPIDLSESLGHFRLSVSSDPAALQKRFAAMKHTYPWAKLATAYAVNGRNDQALQYFSRALKQADGYEARKPIIESAARFDDLLSDLSKRQPDDTQLQLALARKLAERGMQRLAEKQPAMAQAELERSRDIYTRLRAQHTESQWTVLKPTEMNSKGGATLSLLEDGSILASGKNPDRDEYTVVARPPLKHITAIRLEALPDPSLPHNGPGRSTGEGNFHMNKLRVFSGGQPCRLTNIVVDHANMMGNVPSPFQQVIDGELDESPGWGSFPRAGKTNTATIATRVALAPNDDLKIEMVFSRVPRRRQHNLGRFRLAVTNDADAIIKATEFRKDLKDSEIADLNVALARAHAQQGQTNEALASFTEALHLAADRAGKAKIIAEAAPVNGVLEKLAERAAGDGQFQAELARHFAERGNAPLADAARTKARTLFEQQLAAEPDNAALAVELADLLANQPLAQGAVMIRKQSVRLGRQNRPNGIDTIDYGDDGVTEPAEVNGEKCRSVQTRPRGYGHMYFVIDAAFKWAPSMDVQVEVEYWDDTSGNFQIHYDAQDNPYKTTNESVQLTGAKKWKTARFALKEASFANRQNGKADFRILVSGNDIRFRSVSVKRLFDDPWAELAAAYHLIGDQQALDKLVKLHPAAAAGIGDLYAAAQDWERAIAEYRKLVTDRPADVALLTKLATAYQAAGHTREAVPHLVTASAANPKDTLLSLKVAALQAWFGQGKELAATRQRILAFAKGTNDAGHADHAAKSCSILPSTDRAELDAALALGRTAAKVGKGSEWWDWSLLALGMAEYRSGNDAAAYEALRAAAEAGPKNLRVTSISAFYRAMSLMRQDKPDEACKLAIAAAAKMKPLPKDEQNPLAGDAYYDDLILWLAYKEAKAMIKFDAAPAANWLMRALADHRRGETDQAKKACRKATEMLKLAGADAALRPLLRQTVLSLGTDSPEAKELITAAAGDPPAALNEAIKQNPDQAKGYRERGNWYAERGRWNDAIADYADVFRLDPNTLDAMRLGILLAYNGEKDRYREHSQAMLSRWAPTEKNAEADQTLKTHVLLPHYKGSSKHLARLAEAAVAGDQTQDWYEWWLVAKALYDLRSGQYANALTSCRASRQRAPQSKGEPQALTALDLAIEAMALQGAGNGDEARRTLDQAKPLIEGHVPGVDGGSQWQDWLAAHILYREAVGLIVAKKAKPKK